MALVTAHRAFDILSSRLNDFSSPGSLSIGTDPDEAIVRFNYRASYKFFGSGFDFNGFGSLDSWEGKVDRIEVSGRWLTVDDLNLSLETIGDLISANNTRAFWSYVFQGDDVINGSTGRDQLLGFGGNDLIRGGGGADQLNGGAGLDTLSGGADGDTYTTDDAREIPRGTVDAGIDTVFSSISYALGAHQEHLHLTGSKPLNGTGNRAGNELVGNAAANVLDGGAGNDLLDGRGGGDKLRGEAGNDTYVIDRTTEISKGLADAGIDTVRSSVGYTLGPAQEQLDLVGNLNLDGSGNAFANMLRGNGGDNRLDGRDGADRLSGLAGDDELRGGAGNDVLDGGKGNDTLTGGAGRDLFVLHDQPIATNADLITDFEGAGPDLRDLISLDHGLLDVLLPAGPLSAAAFEAGAGLTAAATDSGRVVYDTASGAVYYDADGYGSFALVLHLATVQNVPAGLDASDFIVV